MKLLLTGAYRWQDQQLKDLEADGWQILFAQREDGALPEGAAEVDAAVCNWLFVNHDIRQFEKLKCVQLLSAGLDRVPLDYIQEKGIRLYNARGVYSVPMAEFALCGVLQLYKQSRYFAENQKHHSWVKHRQLLELSGRRVCVLGTGSVGSEVARRFGAFTDEVYGVDLYPAENPLFRAVYPLSELEAQLACSDVVILTLPLTEQTRHMFNRQRLGCMKPGAVLVNIARGGIVDENALLEALENRLLGAVADVFEQEPLPEDSPLWKIENLIITPHNSFVSDGNDSRMWDVIRKNLAAFQGRR